MTYNNSHFNYHHLNRSHYVLYSEWNKDEFPNPTRTASGSRLEGPSKDSANPNDLKIDDEYWDNYLEEEDYQSFKNAKLESNGVVTFTIANLSLPLPSQNTALEVHNEESSTLTGSIFVRDGRVIAKAKHRQSTGGL